MADPARFPYRNLVDPMGTRLLRPILSISLAHHQRTIQTDALIDSGADANVLPYQLGLDLGANWNEARSVPALSGNLGQSEARAIALTIRVRPFDPVRMVFVWTKTDAARLLLVQTNFFQEFHICFFGADGFFEVRRKS